MCQRSGASELLEDVRNYHPVRHGAVIGVHNGIILNDEEIFAAHGLERTEPEMTVDSSAKFDCP